MGIRVSTGIRSTLFHHYYTLCSPGRSTVQVLNKPFQMQTAKVVSELGRGLMALLLTELFQKKDAGDVISWNIDMSPWHIPC